MNKCLKCNRFIYEDDYWCDHGYCMGCAELRYENEQDEY